MAQIPPFIDGYGSQVCPCNGHVYGHTKSYYKIMIYCIFFETCPLCPWNDTPIEQNLLRIYLSDIYGHNTYIHTYIHSNYVCMYVCICVCRGVSKSVSKSVSMVCPLGHVLA